MVNLFNSTYEAYTVDAPTSNQLEPTLVNLLPVVMPEAGIQGLAVAAMLAACGFGFVPVMERDRTDCGITSPNHGSAHLARTRHISVTSLISKREALTKKEMQPLHSRKVLICHLPCGLYALFVLILMLLTIPVVTTAQSAATASPTPNSGAHQPPSARTAGQGKAGVSSTHGPASTPPGSPTHQQPTNGRAPKNGAVGEKSVTGTSGKEDHTPPHPSQKKSSQKWQTPSKPAEIYADDIDAYVQNIAAYAGPRQFVQFADMAAESQRAGKPSAYEQQRIVGSVLGAVMGGALGMLGDDPVHDMAHMAQQGQRVGVGLGTANAYPLENQQLSEGLLSFDLKHKQQLATLRSLLSDCVDTGAELTTCLEEKPVNAQLDAIRTFNLSTCRRLTSLPASGGQILSPGYCSTSSSR